MLRILSFVMMGLVCVCSGSDFFYEYVEWLDVCTLGV